ncbi:MAG: NAD(+)/NADH kinase [Deltaproteobacteria bacterium]|nr:NAD(+)/NADH kinase [Deltaproteobacteria bacterium]
MKKIGLVVKSDAKANEKAQELERWLRSKKIEIVRKKAAESGQENDSNRPSPPPSDVECIFVLGGDGTFLSAVRWIGDQDIPILGIKFGQVGFLAEIAEEDLYPAAEEVLKGDFILRSRMRLIVKVIRGQKTRARETVLNDVVINRGALARLAHIETRIDDHYLTTYSADGLIVATPTGSTAYSLAAGGPVIHPAVPAIILTPICPFTLTNRPLIVPQSANIKIKLAKGSSDIVLTFDGQKGLELNDRDEIHIKKGPHPVHLITLPERQYFDILKNKLKWSGGRA